MFEWVKELSDEELINRWNSLTGNADDDFSEALYFEISHRKLNVQKKDISFLSEWTSSLDDC